MVVSVHLPKHKCLYLGDSSLPFQRTRGTFCTQLHCKAVPALRILKAIKKKKISFQNNSHPKAGLLALARPEVGKAP